MIESKWRWNPGSTIAIQLGCKCPVLDNHYGEGCGYLDDDGEPTFWISEECKMHGTKVTDDKSS